MNEYLFQICLANCVDYKFDVRTTASAYPSIATFTDSPDFCLIFNKLENSCQSTKKERLNDSYNGICDIIENNNANWQCGDEVSTVWKVKNFSCHSDFSVINFGTLYAFENSKVPF